MRILVSLTKKLDWDSFIHEELSKSVCLDPSIVLAYSGPGTAGAEEAGTAPTLAKINSSSMALYGKK